ncbi:DUF4194 domain-containing protein [Citricoccus sp. I39-566]|uniref:DUF4194 domain-containing protein n=1 Tax=Citricoccus sp. I39-566 TaxID=3073268 RepID=UPI00286C72F9|nr:DUF4194 domain-containing protein [Citricoccus sp. I39-566]WMY78549.1 DUF4194 domain-containing protein [Citricoccus sp. I39-566]
MTDNPTETTAPVEPADGTDDSAAEEDPAAIGGATAPDPSRPILWSGDTGTLGEGSRRALLDLLKGPYISGARKPQLWQALVADEDALRSRLHDLFLDLVIDHAEEFAFTRKVTTDDLQVPAALRSEALTFLDTAMLLVLRQQLLMAAGERRVIAGQTEVFEQLSVYRQGDESTWARRLNSSWTKMLNKFNVLHTVDEGRAEISPVLKMMVDHDQARAFAELYRTLAPTDTVEPDDPDTNESAAEETP